jgi:2-dehydro-3-deoxyphosphooctonate aldolase (KDO 8-P synthase)
MSGTITVTGRKFGGKLFLIGGPCVIEDEALCLSIAKEAADICNNLGIDYIFKASFDKANRSSIDSERGPGLEKGLEILKTVKEKAGVPVLTDIHLPGQAELVAQVVDILQIPAFLCRQTDLLEAAAKTGKPVNVKKGQFMAPWDMENVVKKLQSAGVAGIMLTERGSSFGYNSLVTDMRSISQMQEFECPVVIDATHCVQLPGGRGASSGGQREYVQAIALAAVAAGADGLFLEVHPEPDKAPCDPDSMLQLGKLEALLKKAKAVYEAVRE